MRLPLRSHAPRLRSIIVVPDAPQLGASESQPLAPATAAVAVGGHASPAVHAAPNAQAASAASSLPWQEVRPRSNLWHSKRDLVVNAFAASPSGTSLRTALGEFDASAAKEKVTSHASAVRIAAPPKPHLMSLRCRLVVLLSCPCSGRWCSLAKAPAICCCCAPALSAAAPTPPAMEYVPGAASRRSERSSCVIISTPEMESDASHLRRTALLAVARDKRLDINSALVAKVVEKESGLPVEWRQPSLRITSFASTSPSSAISLSAASSSRPPSLGAVNRRPHPRLVVLLPPRHCGA
ncbi:hypothetical protein ZWY2020_025492 [Hordeum vulgare]|nr:hypothetical protein ZWY2020_025492 [Hordeum vulgare]